MYWGLQSSIISKDNSLFIKMFDIYVKNGFRINYVGKSSDYSDLIEWYGNNVSEKKNLKLSVEFTLIHWFISKTSLSFFRNP